MVVESKRYWLENVPEALHSFLPEAQLGYTYWTLYPGTKMGKKVRLGTYVVIESFCEIGEGCLIGNCVTIRPETKIGNRTRVGHNVVIEGECEIGDDCLIQSHCLITKGVIIEDKAFLGPGVITTNDPDMAHLRPHYNWTPSKTLIKRGARIGSGTVITPGITIGSNVKIGAGSVVNVNVRDNAFVSGNPITYFGEVPEEDRL